MFCFSCQAERGKVSEKGEKFNKSSYYKLNERASYMIAWQIKRAARVACDREREGEKSKKEARKGEGETEASERQMDKMRRT